VKIGKESLVNSLKKTMARGQREVIGNCSGEIERSLQGKKSEESEA